MDKTDLGEIIAVYEQNKNIVSKKIIDEPQKLERWCFYYCFNKKAIKLFLKQAKKQKWEFITKKEKNKWKKYKGNTVFLNEFGLQCLPSYKIPTEEHYGKYLFYPYKKSYNIIQIAPPIFEESMEQFFLTIKKYADNTEKQENTEEINHITDLMKLMIKKYRLLPTDIRKKIDNCILQELHIEEFNIRK